MEVSQYLVTTLGNSFNKLLPIGLFLVFSYVFFIYLPFLFFVKFVKGSRTQNTLESVSKIDFKIETNQKDDSDKSESFREKKEAIKKERAPLRSSEEILFKLKAGEVLSRENLKKRYHELLKQHHPDKLSALGPRLKKNADRKTQEINLAYEKLKSKAA